jgi:hypothetical protein
LGALIGGLLEKLGATVTGVIAMAAGLAELLPALGIPERTAHGLVWSAVGLALIVFGKKFKRANDQLVTSEAEKRIMSTALPPVSAVPAIQSEIDRQLRTSSGGGIPKAKNG